MNGPARVAYALGIRAHEGIIPSMSFDIFAGGEYTWEPKTLLIYNVCDMD